MFVSTNVTVYIFVTFIIIVASVAAKTGIVILSKSVARLLSTSLELCIIIVPFILC